MRINRLRFVVLLLAILVAICAPSAFSQDHANKASVSVAEEFKQYDKNNDGVLTPDELDRPKLFQRLDANSDGKITTEEAQAGRGEKPATGGKNRGAALPTPSFANVAYGPHERNVLDIWQAKSDKPTALVVYIHGGGFVGGDKTAVPGDTLKKALESGASYMSISYRYREHAAIQDILRDCARSIQYIRLNAVKYNIDPKRIASFGGSAGAGSSLWLAVHDDLADPKSEDPVLRQSSRIVAAGCVNGQATYNLPEWEKIIFPFKKEWVETPKEFAGFYHFKSDAEFDTEQGKKIIADCSMYSLLTKDDPPLWMSCSLPDVEPTNRGQLLHHPKHMQVIKKRADELGVTCETRLGGDVDGKTWVSSVEFLLKQSGCAAK